MTRKMLLTVTLLAGLPICLFGGISQLVGEWTSTAGITKVQIRVFNGQLKLHVFGACSPEDCDWGEVDAQAYAPSVASNLEATANAVSAQYTTTFSRTLLIAYPLAQDQLRVEVFTVFTDRSGRSPYHMTTVLNRSN